MNKAYLDPLKGRTVLLNRCDRAGLVSFPEMKAVYDVVYPAYEPDPAVVTKIKPLVEGIRVTLVLGTWCGDSKMQVPRFLKLADQLGIDERALTIIAVDGFKDAEEGLLDGLEIEFVPTFIFYGKGLELGRITETPQTTLEEDLLNLLSNQ
ncbi:MAG: thioredoxin family protein [Bacteroidota bacterium]